MLYATFRIYGVRYEKKPITDVAKDYSHIVIQLDGDKHLYIPIHNVEYIIDIENETFNPNDINLCACIEKENF